MSQKTKNYDMFKFRDDNRESINQTHVKKLICSIKARNLLEFKPILVNEKFEVIDGQHRLLAAKALGLDIYYNLDKKVESEDIILLNTVKGWKATDYLNFFVKNGNQEYIKLNQFLKNNQLSLSTAFNFIAGKNRARLDTFKKGEFKFECDIESAEVDHCWNIVDYIRKMNEYASYQSSTRFWKALIKLVKNGMYIHKKMMKNLEKMIERVGPRVSEKDYLKMFMEIYNKYGSDKIDLLEEEQEAA